jgi:ribosomal protein L11
MEIVGDSILRLLPVDVMVAAVDMGRIHDVAQLISSNHEVTTISAISRSVMGTATAHSIDTTKADSACEAVV